MKAHVTKVSIAYKLKLKMVVFVVILFALLTMFKVIETVTNFLLQFFGSSAIFLMVLIIGYILFFIATNLKLRSK